ncbi:2-amino-4-hydroxy-6-hydroxymethyldihydropteridine diphosphokinase [Adhaeribacter sp. BT258]|uniref:2-amino-4-hydroxy-6-hydroxymethyldihydropteridine pyrophosphokinase n=1 Tax=Adhaeribacter terrigena TaxID=2793070 RepID=A0ABS1BYU4_9BACT|nr:2-amino-4-hydroxy-6-hydroxymethyldihydropteridine diphosphokinase [Adhaeribacter terrigena]MBK0402340.1 2-amino-4-hydroxy-6-hydroxymethyldihydropteridine diphosphokinase [Adhaeribacter terrigena]
MNNAFLLLGSNLGDRLSFLNLAITSLQKTAGEIKNLSSVYETAAWGNTEQQAFLNQVLELETSLLPEQLLAQIHHIEKAAGRVRTEHWGPRELDIDILFFGKLLVNMPNLAVPHPQLHLRRFTLLPLAEIAPDLVHPTLHKSVSELLQICPDTLEAHIYHHGKLDL